MIESCKFKPGSGFRKEIERNWLNPRVITLDLEKSTYLHTNSVEQKWPTRLLCLFRPIAVC